MTCNIDHDAENAIPMFLCVACGRETTMINENRQTLEMAGAICAAVEQGQTLEPAVHPR
jgi:Zn ribbon nucleic-acid-binding protein